MFAMRALVLGDMHSDISWLNKLREICAEENFDLVLVTGDITTHGTRETAAEILETFFPAKVMAVPGNMDTAEVLDYLEGKKFSLHRSSMEFKGWKFVGHGGALVGGAGHINFTEEEIYSALKELMGEAGGRKVVLLTHLPPYGTGLDVVESGKHIGSRAVRSIILEFQPFLHLCGHAHEAKGREYLGKTLSVNAGALNEGSATIAELGDEIKLNEIDLGLGK